LQGGHVGFLVVSDDERVRQLLLWLLLCVPGLCLLLLLLLL
jgi:hypothetical protein